MEAYGMTDVGIERDVNQDALFYSTVSVGPLQNLFMVCDGMGGHAAGDFASRFTIENLVGLIRGAKGGQLITTIDTAIKNVNDRLVRHADENLDMY
ncbi:MAG: serine/threonine-protein phosphatase, partial [Lachnospiraceae bacterium]|nr:serine/threonine-protein phosphatase [Lachnospiraceae bacterium]